MDKICESLKKLADECWNSGEYLLFGKYIEELVLRIMKENNWKCYSNNIIDHYAPDLIDYNRNYIIDVKGCKSHYVDLPYKKNARCVKIIEHCIDNYEKICNGKSKALDWEWYICIFDYETDDLFFLDKQKLKELQDSNRIIKNKSLSVITGKVETFIYINPYDLLTLDGFKENRDSKLIKLKKLGLMYNDKFRYNNSEMFKFILKQYFNFKDNYNGLLVTDDSYIYTQYSRNSLNNANYRDYLNEEDCLIIYQDSIDSIKYNLNNNTDDIKKAYIAIYICFDNSEHELKVIEFKELEKLLDTKACPSKMTSNGKAYNISRRLLSNDNEIFF